MRHKCCAIVGIVVALCIIAIVVGITRMSISAVPEPGALETAAATKARNWFIGRAARGPLPAAPADNPAALNAGSGLFDMECTACHGQDGRTPTAIGKSMYPRVLDLGSVEVQNMTDRNLFWVVKNGIRLSGMPGFAHINSDPEIWELTYYVRSLGRMQKTGAPSR